MKRIVCISDTHALHHAVEIPDGDLLLCAGDFTNVGHKRDVKEFAEWFSTPPHTHKITIAGNHDLSFEPNHRRATFPSTEAIKILTDAGILYLEDNSITVQNLTIHGSPQTPWFYDWAFNQQRGSKIRQYWDLIPDNVDILITHGPPYGILDKTIYDKLNVGCHDLLDVIQQKRPKLHLFGHIHECYGIVEQNGTYFANTSICTLHYEPFNKALVFDLDETSGLLTPVQV